MKMVSKFRDYYDSLRSLDCDDTPLYLRMTHPAARWHHRRARVKNGRVTTEHRLQGWRTRASREDRALRDAVDPLWTQDTVPPVPPEPRRRGVVAFCGRIYAYVRNHDTLEVRYTFAHFDDDLDAYHRRQWHHFERTRARTVADDAFRFFDAPVIAMTPRN